MFSDIKALAIVSQPATTKCSSATSKIGSTMSVPSAPTNRMFLFLVFYSAAQVSNKRLETIVAAAPVSTNANTDCSLTLIFTYLLEY